MLLRSWHGSHGTAQCRVPCIYSLCRKCWCVPRVGFCAVQMAQALEYRPCYHQPFVKCALKKKRAECIDPSNNHYLVTELLKPKNNFNVHCYILNTHAAKHKSSCDIYSLFRLFPQICRSRGGIEAI